MPPTAFDPVAFARFLSVQEDLGTKWAPRFVRLADADSPDGDEQGRQASSARARRGVTDRPVWWRPFVGRGADDEARSTYRLLMPADVDALQDEFAAHGRGGLLEF